MEFKEKILQAQDHILDLSEHPAQAVAIALTIAVNVATLHLKAREFKVGIGKDVYKVEIKRECEKTEMGRMKKGEFWDSEDVVEKGVDEDCTIHWVKKNLDGSITIDVRVNAYNIDEKDDCYSGTAKIKLKKS